MTKKRLTVRAGDDSEGVEISAALYDRLEQSARNNGNTVEDELMDIIRCTIE